jgi:hypothetical protein
MLYFRNIVDIIIDCGSQENSGRYAIAHFKICAFALCNSQSVLGFGSVEFRIICFNGAGSENNVGIRIRHYLLKRRQIFRSSSQRIRIEIQLRVANMLKSHRILKNKPDGRLTQKRGKR